MNTTAKGRNFEGKIADLYRLMGRRVEQNVMWSKDTKNGIVKAEFDLVYRNGIWRRKNYVECKYREHDIVVFSDVAVFTSKLELIGVPYKRGELVTNTGFDNRSHEYARKVGIELIDEEKLVKLYTRSIPLPKRFIITITGGKTLEELMG